MSKLTQEEINKLDDLLNTNSMCIIKNTHNFFKENKDISDKVNVFDIVVNQISNLIIQNVLNFKERDKNCPLLDVMHDVLNSIKIVVQQNINHFEKYGYDAVYYDN